MQKCGSPNASKTTKSATAVLPIPTMVCSSCVGPNNVFSSFMIWLPLFGIFNVLTQMLGHVTADRGCTNTVRESALKGDSGGEHPLQHGGIKPVSVLHMGKSCSLALELLSSCQGYGFVNATDDATHSNKHEGKKTFHYFSTDICLPSPQSFALSGNDMR